MNYKKLILNNSLRLYDKHLEFMKMHWKYNNLIIDKWNMYSNQLTIVQLHMLSILMG